MSKLIVISLFIQVSLATVPPDWQPRVQGGNMLYADKEPSDGRLMASVGNGYVATVVGSDTQYISGVFNGFSSKTPSHRARIPGTLSISVANSTPLGSALDLERGVFYRRSVLLDAQNQPLPVNIEQRWYAHRALRHVTVHELTATVVGSSGQFSLSLSVNTGSASSDIAFKQGPQTSAYTAFVGATDQAETNDSTTTTVAVVTSNIPASIALPNGTTTYYFLTTFRTSLDSQDPVSDAVADYENAAAQQTQLLDAHIAAWLQVWSARMEVTGDLALAQAINSSLYYILSSVRPDWPYSLSPGGLASNGYNGHSFWDCETWMYPTLMVFFPDVAASLLDYRFNRIPGAEQKAKSYNPPYAGAMFPWESAFTGEEVCPSWAATGTYEQHISGDIAFATQNYWYVTRNVTWLRDVGFPLLEGIATFWASRVQYLNGNYSINNVIPPDEYAQGDNSVFTNVVAQYSLQFATEAGKILGVETNSSWPEIASGLVILFDPTLQIHPEYAGYHGQTIKQADVVLLGFPLDYPMTQAVRKNDVVYYANRTDPAGPAMTWSMHTVAWLELGDLQNAVQVFNRSFANIQAPFNVWTEVADGSGTVNFLTGAGGFLQAIWAGWGGVRINADGITFNPTVGPNFSAIKYSNLHYLGNFVDISFDSTGITFQAQGAIDGATALAVTAPDGRVHPLSTTPLTVPLGRTLLAAASA
eukprot:TRINITY_DN3701_c0_g1_i1.p1 TRINITY_DN3701_c0_g1~~TRINITY_DN3701_c0_g1_i1.p1  ORF type:complete len:702 (-),score=253.28 TRINITY_DN3701_c0_g1_i1:809-2914(-)